MLQYGILFEEGIVEFKVVTENKKYFMDLLLLADESEVMIDKYVSVK